MAETNIDINGGHSQVNPAATQAVQNNYYGTPVPLHEEVAARMVVVLGAGVDTAAGFSNPCSLVPKITEWLETDEGKAVDAALRKLLKGLRFSYAKFVDNAIERLAHDLDRERETICSRVTQELEQNDHLDEGQRKMGQLIVRLFHKITEVKDGAAIDEETEELIREVTGIDPTEETIIDFSHVNYTKTFEDIVKYILQTSLHDTENPILRHVYTNLLDIGQLLAQHFYGFFTNKPSEIKTYLYIAWTLWAYLAHEEQTVVSDTGIEDSLPIYGQLNGKEKVQVITFNYTTLAANASPSTIYFNGNLNDYVDIENKNDLQVDDIHAIDLVRFFQDRLSEELSLEGDRLAIPIPSFMPPLKLKPVISGKYVTTWYRTAEALAHAERILILGHSLHGGDAFFNDILRANRKAETIIIDRDLETACKDVCATFQQQMNRYTSLTVQGYPARKYDNRITVIGASMEKIDLNEWLK
jgi:DNA-binding transcriptional regulator YhcF (GntR family)